MSPAAPQQFEVVEAFMPRNLAFPRNRNRSRQQKTSPVARVTDSLAECRPAIPDAAASNALGSRIAVSNSRARRSCAIRHLPARSFHPRG